MLWLEHGQPPPDGRTVPGFTLDKEIVLYVTKAEATSPIHGELHRVHLSVLERLDLFEGNPVWNCREQVEVVLDRDNSTVSAWMYCNDTPQGELVPSGVYTR